MDWLSAIIGAIIGFASSVGVILVQRMLDNAGKVEIYSKVVYDRITDSTWGFFKGPEGVLLQVPLALEIQNLSSTTRIFRDINLLLVSEKKKVATMIQISSAENKGKETYLFANEGGYSLSLDGGKIKRLDCKFLLKASSDVPSFDEILLRYYDEKNRVRKFSLGQVEGDWTVKEFPRNSEWIKLEEKK